MHRNINIEIPNPKKFIDALNNNEIFEIGSEHIWDLGFDTKPFADYEATDNYPECCDYHIAIKKNSNEWFNKFPNCCDDHKKLTHKKWFKKEVYNHVPKKIIQQISFSENFISKNINEENWYQEITDYLTYNFESFGTPNIGSHLYFSYIQHWVESNKPTEYEFSKWKRNQLIEFLQKTSEPSTEKQTDLNILKSTFEKWLKTIPSLNYFVEMKGRLRNRIPFGVILHEPKFNRFTGLTKFKIKTEFELIEILIESTKKMLTAFNSPELLKNGAISDANKHHFDLINESHSSRQNKLLIDYNQSEIKYVKIIKKWLKNEKEYFTSITPIIKELKSMPKKFEIEKRNTFEKDYLKVFVRDKSSVEQVATLLASLESVRKANVTKNTELDITVYPSKMYDIDEVQEEISAYLESYFESGELDPAFEDKISLISSKGYSDILHHIYVFGRNLEKLTNLHKKFDEEGFREYFLPYLNALSSKHSATGETFNKIGKTDILIQDESGSNVFIAECKLWKGEGELLKAIDQLIDRYVTWRDEKVALIVFNKDMNAFTDLLSKATNKMKEHKLFDSYVGQRFDTSFSYTFKHSDDPKKIIQLELMIFNCR